VADLPTRRPRPYPDFRESSNIDDRRDSSEAAEWARALLAASGASMPQPDGAAGQSPLSSAVGVDDIVRSHGLWLLRQAMEQQPRSFNERIEPVRKLPFGLGG
jgi:hypothetical protein